MPDEFVGKLKRVDGVCVLVIKGGVSVFNGESVLGLHPDGIGG
jgi:hypothetical protein